MEPIALVAAVAAGVAVLLLIIGVLEPSRNVAAERLDQFVIAPNTQAPTTTTEKASLRQIVARSPIVTVPNRLVERRSWSDGLARDLARADLTLKPFEYLVVQVLAVLGMIGLFWLLGRTILPVLGNPFLLIAAALLGIFLPRTY